MAILTPNQMEEGNEKLDGSEKTEREESVPENGPTSLMLKLPAEAIFTLQLPKVKRDFIATANIFSRNIKFSFIRKILKNS
jgi:hypothetical protein